MVDHPDILNAAFVSQHGDGKNFSNPQRLNLRLDLARKMISGHYAHLAKDLETAAVTHHEKEMMEWKVALENLSEAEDVPLYVPPFPSMSVVTLHSCFTVPVILSSMLYIPSSVGSVYMPTATFRSSSVILARMSRTTGSSPRGFNALFDPDVLLTIKKASIGGQGTITNSRVGRNGIRRGLTPELLVRS